MVMIIMEVSTAPFSSKEPGGIRIVTAQILMVYIFVEVIPPLLMEWTGKTGKDIITL